MKHCVLITAYKDAKQINRLIGRIPQEWGIFIHIDKKSPISCKDISDRAIKIGRRPIYWGSFVHVEVFLDMMEMAMADKRHFDYFHLITGQDYPAIDLRKADTLIEPRRRYTYTTSLSREVVGQAGTGATSFTNTSRSHDGPTRGFRFATGHSTDCARLPSSGRPKDFICHPTPSMVDRHICPFREKQ